MGRELLLHPPRGTPVAPPVPSVSVADLSSPLGGKYLDFDVPFVLTRSARGATGLDALRSMCRAAAQWPNVTVELARQDGPDRTATLALVPLVRAAADLCSDAEQTARSNEASVAAHLPMGISTGIFPDSGTVTSLEHRHFMSKLLELLFATT